jgi:hypothetical protein
VPSFRDRIPVLVDRVTTLTGPGELVDVVVTERGIAINPRRATCSGRRSGSGLPIRPIREIKAEVEAMIGGRPAPPRLTDRPVAIVKWVDGTVLDTVWQVDCVERGVPDCCQHPDEVRRLLGAMADAIDFERGLRERRDQELALGVDPDSGEWVAGA